MKKIVFLHVLREPSAIQRTGDVRGVQKIVKCAMESMNVSSAHMTSYMMGDAIRSAQSKIITLS